MSVIVKVPEPNLWDEICKEFAKERPPFDSDEYEESVATDYTDFNPAKHNPVFYGEMFAHVEVDDDVYSEFDAAVSHPSCIGYCFTSKPPKLAAPSLEMAPNRYTCTPTEYLNHFVFPYLLPAIEAMLRQAKLEKCFERRRTKFNACDFITEYLFKNNPWAGQEERQLMELQDIPFVKEWLKDHPRPPLPKSLVLTDEEAAVKIQSFWRGFLIRRDSEVQELRVWQREWREENQNIQDRVTEFWGSKMPGGDESASVASEEQGGLTEVNSEHSEC